MTTDRRPALVWRIVLVLAAVTLVWLLTIHGLGVFFGDGYDRLGHAVRALLTTALAVPVVVLARRVLDRRPWAGLRLGSPRTGWRPLLLGMGCYLVPATAALAVCVAFGWTEIGIRTSAGEVLLLAASLLLLVFLYEALPEELIFRGYLYRNLTTALPPWQAVLAQAALFALWGTIIGAAGSVDRVVLFFCMSVVLGMFRAVTGSVWAPVGFHLAFQTVEQLAAGGVRDGHLTVSNPLLLEAVTFGLVPLALGVPVLELVHRRPTNWRDPEPDPPPTIRPTMQPGAKP